ncbi:MAG: hypothetical protein PHC88_12490 [Terrimicrobiaceae bacterium]|nr:hypothetical protein [Terrimicrobiaceae bacterium]
MKIERRNIDDLKTERPDITPCLPAYFRLVPILFYAVILGGVLLSTFFLLVLRNAASSQEQWINETAQRKQALADVQAERNSVERQTRRATDVVAWIEGARNIQPLVAAVIRSMEPASSIAELGLARDPAVPSQIKLTLKLNTQGSHQLDATLEKIAALSFRTYNPNQTQARGETDYEATLIYQSAHAPLNPLHGHE